jgi:hypothetical protein
MSSFFEKIYPGLSKLTNYKFLKENPIYLIYHVVVISITVYSYMKIYNIYSGARYFLFEGIPLFYKDISSELCKSNIAIKYLLMFLIPIYNPLFLLYYLVPLNILFSYLPVSFVNSSDNKTRNATSWRAFVTYYLSSVLSILYTILYVSCEVTEAT